MFEIEYMGYDTFLMDIEKSFGRCITIWKAVWSIDVCVRNNNYDSEPQKLP